MQRRMFLGVATAAGLVAPFVQRQTAGQDTAKVALDADMVKEFVTKSHFDLKGVTGLLDEEPALVNAAWDWGEGDWETGLGAASHTGQAELARLLLSRGARLDSFAAVTLAQVDVVTALLKANPMLHQTPGPHGISLLGHGVMSVESERLVTLLLDHGADVNQASNGGTTPLMMAANRGDQAVAELLVKRGADVGLADARGRTALSIAQKKEHEDLAQWLQSLGDKASDC